jgi:hypothetical protein
MLCRVFSLPFSLILPKSHKMTGLQSFPLRKSFRGTDADQVAFVAVAKMIRAGFADIAVRRRYNNRQFRAAAFTFHVKPPLIRNSLRLLSLAENASITKVALTIFPQEHFFSPS